MLALCDQSCYFSALQKTNMIYKEKLKSVKASEKTMLTLLWDLEEMRKLNDTGRTLLSDITRALDIIMCPVTTQECHNLPQKMSSIRSQLRAFTKSMFHFKRVPASHIFCLMISTELRNCKPYVIPVQCLPYATLTEKDMRQMINNLIQEMVQLGINVAGM